LRTRVAFAWPAMDAFYEEDERIVGHAADSYHRIDIRQTSRHLLVRYRDRIIADTKRPMVLYMKLISVNCGLPREVVWHGRSVTTSIYKEPVRGRIALRTLNLDSDRQSDLTVHGGRDKAVYCYSIAHYDYWKAELPDRTLPIGIFGENFTIEGLTEDDVHIGDRFSVGSAEIMVTQPRLPCYKLGIRFESDEMVKRFLDSRRTGFYAAVTREGDVEAGDEVAMLRRDPHSVSVSEIVRLYVAKQYSRDDVRQVQRALTSGALPDGWKEDFQEKLNRLRA
jgi:MOSC domain-containing protein YiiM